MFEVLITLFITGVALLSLGSVGSSLATAFAAAGDARRALASCDGHMTVTIRAGATTDLHRPAGLNRELRTRQATRPPRRTPSRQQPRRAAAA